MDTTNLVIILTSRVDRYNNKQVRYKLLLDEDDIDFVIVLAKEASVHFGVDVIDIFTSCRNNQNRKLQLVRRTIREILLKKEYTDYQVRALIRTGIDYHLNIEKLGLSEEHPHYELYCAFKKRFL